MIIQAVGDACCRQNVEREILPLSAGNIRMTVDPATAESTRNVRNQPAARRHKIVVEADVEPEIVVFDPAKNRFSHGANIKLIITAEPRMAVHDSPTNPSC